jgi:hypothetical protein
LLVGFNWLTLDQFPPEAFSALRRFLSLFSWEYEPMTQMKNYWNVLAVLLAIGLWASSAVASGITYTTLSYLGAFETFAGGISGNDIVGWYESRSAYNGFLYNGSTWTTLDDPLAVTSPPIGTCATDIDGNNIVGYFYGPNGFQGFVATVPEPSTFALLSVGAAAFIAYRWRRRGK